MGPGNGSPSDSDSDNEWKPNQIKRKRGRPSAKEKQLHTKKTEKREPLIKLKKVLGIDNPSKRNRKPPSVKLSMVDMYYSDPEESTIGPRPSTAEKVPISLSDSETCKKSHQKQDRPRIKPIKSRGNEVGQEQNL